MISKLLIILLLVPGILWADHPKMFFTNADTAALRAKAATGAYSSMWNHIIGHAEALIDSGPEADPGAGALNDYFRPANDLVCLAFAYVITDSAEYLARAEERLLAFTGWDTWGEGAANEDLCHGAMLLGNALAYDWCYGGMSAGDRDSVRDNLVMRASQMYNASIADAYQDTLNNWWRKTYSHNHWSKPVLGGLGIASLALEGDADTVDTFLAHAISEAQRDSALQNGMTDGTYHESHMYQRFKFMSTLPFLYCLKDIKGRDFIDDTYYANFAEWEIYNYLTSVDRPLFPHDDQTASGWGYDAYGPFTALRFVASELSNGHAEWMSQQSLATHGARVVHEEEYSVFEFLWFDSTVIDTTPTDLNLYKWFTDLDCVVWKTSWDSSGFTFGLHSGLLGGKYLTESYVDSIYPYTRPAGDQQKVHVGHNQGDAGTFAFYRGSVDLCSERDAYSDFNIENHNIVVIDSNEQFRPTNNEDVYVNSGGKIDTVFNVNDFNYLRADVTDACREVSGSAPGNYFVDEYKRYVTFSKVDSAYIVMVDNIHDNVTRTYEWFCHFDIGGTVTAETDWIKGATNETGNHILGVRVLAPASLDTVIGTHSSKPYVLLRPSTDDDSVRFVNVLWPSTTSDWGTKPTITLLGDTLSGAGVRVALNGQQDHIFRFTPHDSTIIAEYTLKADAASIAYDSGEPAVLINMFMGNGTMFYDTSGVLAQSLNGNDLTFGAIFINDSLALDGDAVLDSLKIYAPNSAAGKVTVNGALVSATKSGDFITLDEDATGYPKTIWIK